MIDIKNIIIKIIKNKTYVFIIALAFVVIAAGITVLVLKSSSSNNTAQTKSTTVSGRAAIDVLLDEAAVAHDAATAKAVYLKARQKYQDIGDTDRVQAVDAQILLIDSTEPKK